MNSFLIKKSTKIIFENHRCSSNRFLSFDSLILIDFSVSLANTKKNGLTQENGPPFSPADAVFVACERHTSNLNPSILILNLTIPRLIPSDRYALRVLASAISIPSHRNKVVRITEHHLHGRAARCSVQIDALVEGHGHDCLAVLVHWGRVLEGCAGRITVEGDGHFACAGCHGWQGE